jgi:hypothetical protein
MPQARIHVVTATRHVRLAKQFYTIARRKQELGNGTLGALLRIASPTFDGPGLIRLFHRKFCRFQISGHNGVQIGQVSLMYENRHYMGFSAENR